MQSQWSENQTPSSSIIDIGNILVGHAQNTTAVTGCTFIRFLPSAVCGIDIRGSAGGTRSIDSLDPMHVVPAAHGVLFTGGSVFGLASVDGVIRYLEAHDIGFPVGRGKIPTVPAAVIFDLNTGDHQIRPDPEMGWNAAVSASDHPLWGSVGVGTGATIGKLFGIEHATKGGVGTACVQIDETVKVGALVVVNAFGNVVDPMTGKTIAGARKPDGSGFYEPEEWIAHAKLIQKRLSFASNTTLALVATNAKLTKIEATKVAQMSHDGFARCIQPVHTMLDGDIVIAASCGTASVDVNLCGFAAAQAVIQAILHAVQSAQSLGEVPSLNDLLNS